MGWLPAQGYVHPTDDWYEHFKSMALPAISLAVGQIAAYMRLLRSDMIATLQEDYILMAKAKGMPTRRVLWRHALRPSSLTLLTVAGLNIGALIGGTVVIEVIFGIPGMGTQLFQAIFQRQFVELQSIVAIIAIGYVLVNVVHRRPVLHPRPKDPRCSGNRIAPTPMPRCRRSWRRRPRPAEEAKYEAPRTKRLGIGGYLAAGWLIFVVLVAILVPLFAKTHPSGALATKGFLSSLSHPFGGDGNGNDMTVELAEGDAQLVHRRARRGRLRPARRRHARADRRLLPGPARHRAHRVFNILLAIPQFILAVSLVAVLANNQVDQGRRPRYPSRSTTPAWSG